MGATGVAQICDLVLQIRGEAGERQVARNEIGAGAESGRLGRHVPWSRYWRRHDGRRVYTETVIHSAPEAFVQRGAVSDW